MVYPESRSVSELRRQSERTRDELTRTVEQLKGSIADTADDIRQKVSPENIKAEVKDYVADKGRSWLDGLKQQATENPMQALAAGAAVGIPLLRMARGVPLPLLMIGAGLALSSSRVRQAVADQMSANETASAAAESLGEARKQAGKVFDDGVASVTERARDAGQRLTETTANITDQAVTAASDAKNAVLNKTADLTETVVDAAAAAQTKISEAAGASREYTAKMVGENALLIGGVGLAIGALLAASLPSTTVEAATFGKASDTARKAASEAAGGALDRTQEQALGVARHVAEKVSDAAGSAISEAADAIADKLKSAPEQGVNTAFDNTPANNRGHHEHN